MAISAVEEKKIKQEQNIKCLEVLLREMRGRPLWQSSLNKELKELRTQLCRCQGPLWRRNGKVISIYEHVIM